MANSSRPGDPTPEDEFDRRWRELAAQLESEMPRAADQAAGQSTDQPGDQSGEPAAREAGPGIVEDQPADYDAGWVSAPLELAGPRDWAEAPDFEEHFTPPEEPPVTSREPLLVVSWAATAIGLLGLAWWVVFRPLVSVYVPRGFALLIAVGLGVLVWLMPHNRDDSGDTGARL